MIKEKEPFIYVNNERIVVKGKESHILTCVSCIIHYLINEMNIDKDSLKFAIEQGFKSRKQIEEDVIKILTEKMFKKMKEE